MKLKHTKLDEGEQLIEGPFECKMGDTSKYDHTFKHAKNHSNEFFPRKVVAFTTDKRIIVEATGKKSEFRGDDGKRRALEDDITTYSFFHRDIESTTGKNKTFWSSGFLTIKFFDKGVSWLHGGLLDQSTKLNDIDHGGDFSEKLSKFYPEDKFEERKDMYRVHSRESKIIKAKNHEKMLEFDEAVMIYQELEIEDEVIRVRKLKSEQGAVKVDQTVVHGDYVDDRDTIIKDSVVSKSSIGAGGDGGDLTAKLQQLAQMHKDGILSDEQFEAAKNKLLN